MPDDAAFLWETAALRGRKDAGGAPTASVTGHAGDDRADWVTLREAHEESGVPMSTLRKWARKDRIPSRLDVGPDHRLRLVDLDAVHRLAAERAAPTDPAAVAPSAVPGAVPEGSMIVPLDAWQKMMTQLGNLHEAGQQLAEARERAAKAETEAAFLRERLTELRQERDRTLAGEAPPPAAPEPVPAESRHPYRLESLWDRALREWRHRRRR
jgi:hypothetical protein